MPSLPHRRLRRSRAGFSIIELLVVVSILTMLVALLLPALGQAKQTAKQTICLTRQRSIGLALQNYTNANRGYFPSHTAKLTSGQTIWGDAYGLRRDHPYSGEAERPAVNLGLLVSSNYLPSASLGDIIHCPSFTGNPQFPGHCMDTKSAWAYGGSGWNDFPRHRILGSYNYRGTSYTYFNKKPMRTSNIEPHDITVIDTPDQRFRGVYSEFNNHGGYNYVSHDGSGSFFADKDFRVDELILLAVNRKTVDGRGNDGRGTGSLDESIYEYIVQAD